MSRLDELIQEYCPDGVEYKALEEVCRLVTGATPSKTKSEYWDNGTIPWMSSGEVNLKRVYKTESKITQLGYDKTSTTMVPVHSVVIALAGQGKTRGKVAITEIELCTNQSLCSIICSDKILYKFLYYYLDGKYEELRTISNGDGTRGGLSLRILNPYLVPIPPLPVQEEIVRILDSFAELTAELQTHLHEELQARQKQYEYYCNYLLPFGKDTVQKVSLGNLCSIARGASPRPIKNFITSDDDGVNWIKIGDANPGAKYIQSCKEKISLEGAKKSRYVYPGDFILSNSMSFGRPYILQIEGCIHDGWLSLSDFEEALIPDYLYHVLMSSHIQKIMHQKASFGGAVQNLNADIVRGIEIPVPSLNEQRRIASLLDHFNTLCNDLTSGLPAEIENRQKQYEYYRDKLLTFKPLP